MHYIALGIRRTDRKKRTTVGVPFKVYAITSVEKGEGKPPFYNVAGIDGNGDLILKELYGNEHEKVRKWVSWGKRRIFRNPRRVEGDRGVVEEPIARSYVS